MITAHEGDSAAYTWRLSHLTIGEQVLLSCCNVSITPSGNSEFLFKYLLRGYWMHVVRCFASLIFSSELNRNL